MHYLTMQGNHGRPWSVRAVALLLLCALALMALPKTARADCGFSSGSATTVTFDAGTITLTPSTQIGQVLWTSSTASPANPPELACNGNTSGGIVNTIAGPPTGTSDTFPTGIPGISYRLLHPDDSHRLTQYPDYTTGSGTFNVSTNLALVYTGPFLPPNNSTLTGQLSQWKVDICDEPLVLGPFYFGCNGTVAPRPVETFNIHAIIHIEVPTCDIDPDSVNKSVVLPPVNTQQLTGIGSHAGTTAFQLDLTNCPNQLHVFLSLHADDAFTGATGVINSVNAGTAGYAEGVGVQVLDASSNPITFDTPFLTGTTSASNYAIQLKARYYRTSGTLKPGDIKAVATYTLNYQ